MSGQRVAITNTQATGQTQTFRAAVFWPRGQHRDIGIIQQNYRMSVDGTSYETYWETCMCPHRDGSIWLTYAVWTMTIAGGVTNPTRPQVFGQVVQELNAVSPPTFPSWFDELDITLDYEENDPVNGSTTYSFNLGGFARNSGNADRLYQVEETNGSRWVTYAGWTGPGTRGHPTDTNIQFAGNLRVFAELEFRTGDSYAKVEFRISNSAAWSGGSRAPSPTGDPTRIPLPATRDANALRNINDGGATPARVTFSHNSVPIFSAPIGVSDFTTGASPLGTIAPDSGGWRLGGIRGLNHQQEWPLAFIVSDVSQADAENKATYWDSFLGIPTWATALTHRRQQDLLGQSVAANAYGIPGIEVSQQVLDEGFANNLQRKANFLADVSDNPWRLLGATRDPAQGGGVMRHLGYLGGQYGRVVVANSPGDLYEIYCKTLREYGCRWGHFEIEALKGMDILYGGDRSNFYRSANWDGCAMTGQLLRNSGAAFGIMQRSNDSTRAFYGNAQCVRTNPDTRAQTAGWIWWNDQHASTWPLYWLALVTGSRTFKWWGRMHGYLHTLSQHDQTLLPGATHASNTAYYPGATARGGGRANGRFHEVSWVGRMLSDEQEERDFLYQINARRLADALRITDPTNNQGGSYWTPIMSTNTPNNFIAYEFGLQPTQNPSELLSKDIRRMQSIPWHQTIFATSSMLWAFESPEGSGIENYRDGCARLAMLISRFICKYLTCLEPGTAVVGAPIPVESKEDIDDWYQLRQENRRARGQPLADDGVMWPKSREIDEFNTTHENPVYTNFAVDLSPRAQGQTMQNFPSYAIGRAFQENLEFPGWKDRALIATFRAENEFNELRDGRNYYTDKPVLFGEYTGANGGNEPGFGVEPVPPMPPEGEEPPDPEVRQFPPPNTVQVAQSRTGIYEAFVRGWTTRSDPIARTRLGLFESFTRLGPTDPTGVTGYIGVPLDEPEDVRCEIVASSDEVGEAILTGPGLVPVYHGMGTSQDPVSMETFNQRLYVANGVVRPVEYSEHGAAKSGLTPPNGEVAFEVTRKTLGVRDIGAKQLAGDVAAPNIIQNVTSHRFTSDDVGKWILVPSEAAFAADGPDILERIASVTSPTSVTLENNVLNAQVGAAVSMWLFPDKSATVGAFLSSIPYTTPYSAKRPIGNGADTIAPGDENPLCLGLSKQHVVRCSGVDLQVSQDSVVDFKGYFRAARINKSGRTVLWTRRSEDNKSTWELSLVEGGKLEWRFWDVDVEEWRGIKTIGICMTPNEWYYVRLRYRFKGDGGWQPDERWLLRDANSLPMAENYRDGLWCWALENNNPADPLLLVSGVHNAFNVSPGTLPNIQNTSREIGNTGYLAEDPWIGPRFGDGGYNQGGLATQRPSMFKATRAGGAFTWQMVNAAGSGPEMSLARWMSSNRDEPWHHDGTEREQIWQNGGNYYSTGVPLNGPNTSSLVTNRRAVLCYVYGPDGGTEFGTPRILALVGVGDTDINLPESSSKVDSTFILDDSTDLGADGLGDLAAGDYIIALALPNGENHATQATGNTDPVPTLLVQNERPVGTNDAPMELGHRVFIGGVDRAKETDQGFLNFEGQIDDIGYSIAELAETAEVYTADHMPPDVQFNGPVDPRIGSLPALAFSNTSLTEAGIPVTQLGEATWSSRCDTIRGGRLEFADGSGGHIAAEILGSARENQKVSGTHRVAVTFYDRARGHESPPSEVGAVTFQSSPDEFEPDAERAIEVLSLPSSGERNREVWRRIYATAPDGGEFFLLAEVRDNETSRVRAVLDPAAFFQGGRIDFEYQNPPPCLLLASSEGRMFYAGLTDPGAKGVVAWSDPQFPWQVPGDNRTSLEAADGGIITALFYNSGLMYAFSRGAIFSGEDLGEFVRFRRLQASTGAVGHHGLSEVEDAAFFPSERGVFAFDGVSRVQELSELVEPSYRGFNPIALQRAQAAYSRRRGQYLLASTKRGETYPTEMMTAEVRLGTLPVWSREIHPQGITSLFSGADLRTDEREVYQGSLSGFLMQLDAGDRPRAQYDGSALYGVHEAKVLGGADFLVGLDNPAFDDALDGISGVPYVIVRTTDGHTRLIDRGFCWRFDGTYVHTMVRVSDEVRYGDRFLLGGWAMQWSSKAFDFRRHTDRVQLEDVDLTFQKKPGEVLEMTVHRDFEDEAQSSQTVALDKGFDLPNPSTRGSYVQVRLLWAGRRPFAIYNLALRAQLATQTGGDRGAST